MPKGNKPKYIARAKKEDDSDYMQTIGAAWPFKEGEGLVIKLDLMPTNAVSHYLAFGQVGTSMHRHNIGKLCLKKFLERNNWSSKSASLRHHKTETGLASMPIW